MKKNRRNRPVTMAFAGNTLRIRARVHFSGCKDAKVRGALLRQCILDELRRQFSADNPYFARMKGNALDFPEKEGEPISVEVSLLETNRRPYVRFVLLPVLGVSCAAFFPLWRPWGSKTLVVFAGDVRTRYRYSPHQAALVACHEFGHALGIGDLYGGAAPYGLCYRQPAAITAELPADDLMRSSFRNEWFTPNDLEMALLAQRECAPQTHVPTGWWWKGLNRVSSAVRGESVDPAYTALVRKRARQRRREKWRRALAKLGFFKKKP